MADTARSTSDLLALLADNTTGDISPQDVRDVLASFVDYASLELSAVGGPVVMSAVGTTPTVVNVADTATDASGIVTGGLTASLATEKLTVGTTGVYLWGFDASFTLATANKLVTLTPFVDGAAGSVTVDKQVTNTGDTVAVSFTGIITRAAAEELDVRISVDTGTSDISFVGWSLWTIRIG